MALEVDNILINQAQAKNLLSSGLHGLTEDLRAKASKMNYVGRRFSKENFDVELDDRLAELEEIFRNSSGNTNGYKAKVDAFVEFEKLHAEHTIIERSIFGERSVGEKYYSPLAEELDYSNDPFIRDLLTTGVLLTGTISAVNGMRVEFQQEEILNEQQLEALRINAHNTKSIEYANEAGNVINEGKDTFIQGMEAQAYQTDLTIADMIERGVLDKNLWQTYTNSYRLADNAGHAFYNAFHEGVRTDISSIINDCASGAIDKDQALELLNDVTANSQATLNNVTDHLINITKDYASTHPQFDLDAVIDVMNHIKQNPTAISDMNQVIVDISSYGDGLAGLTVEEVAALESLPSDIGTTLLAAASGTALALRVANKMNGKTRSNSYGNEITDIINEYIEEEYEKEELESSKNL